MKQKDVIVASAAAAGLAGLGALAWAVTKDEPLETVSHVDLEQYLGLWYEIARFPQSFEEGCSCSVAEYSMNEDGSIRVLNSCFKDGELHTAEGSATVTDKKTNAKLKVKFFAPFTGKYWIIALASDYSYAMVGHPNRKYLWILARKPQMNNQVYNHLVVQAAGQSFDIRKLVKTVQDCEHVSV